MTGPHDEIGPSGRRFGSIENEQTLRRPVEDALSCFSHKNQKDIFHHIPPQNPEVALNILPYMTGPHHEIGPSGRRFGSIENGQTYHSPVGAVLSWFSHKNQK